MARFRFGLVVVGALAFGLSACGGSDPKPLNLGLARAEIKRVATEGYGGQFDVGSVDCPAKVPQEEGVSFFCTVEIEGEPLRIYVKQNDDQGHVSIAQAQSVMVTKNMEGLVASYLDKQATPARAVSCGDTVVIIGTVGKKLTCTVDYPDGRKAVATLGVKDTKAGTALLSVKPVS